MEQKGLTGVPEVKSKKKSGVLVVYCILFFAMSLAPLAVTLAKGLGGTLPPLEMDGETTIQGRCDRFESWFSENLGLKDELITGIAAAEYALLGQSPVSEVVAGRDGWLFYASTTADYCGTRGYSGRTVYRIAKTVELMAGYAKDNGAVFVFAAAPNKNSVYPQFMPYYAKRVGASTLDMVGERLENRDYYVDLKRLFAQRLDSRGTQYYHKLDSHWNNLGALEVYRAVQESVTDQTGGDYSCDMYENLPRAAETAFEPDLAGMLFPAAELRDVQYDLGIERRFTAKSPLVNEMAAVIETDCAAAGRSLAFFRDSFANSLIELFSNNYRTVVYRRAVPYDLRSAVEEGRNTIIVEIAERNLIELVDSCPVIDAPPTDAPRAVKEKRESAVCSISESERRVEISGVISEDIPLGTCDDIYIECRSAEKSVFFEALPIANGDKLCDRGFSCTLHKAELPAGEYALYLHIGGGDGTRAYKLVKL